MENGNTLRDKIIEDLNVYYSNEGIVPDDFFACKHKKNAKGNSLEECNVELEINMGKKQRL